MGGSSTDGISGADTPAKDGHEPSPWKPCEVCGSAIVWYRKSKGKERTECCGCYPVPSNPFMRRALMVIVNDRVELADYEQELAEHNKRINL